MIETPDLIIRTLAVATTLVAGGILWGVGRYRPAARPAAMFSLAIAAFVLTSVPNAQSYLGYLVWPLTALCVTKAVWFWFFSRLFFGEPLPPKTSMWMVVLFVAMAGTWQQMVFLARYREGINGPLESAAGFGVDVVLATFVGLALHTAWKGMKVDLIETRRQLRVVFLTATGIYLVAALVVNANNLLMGERLPTLMLRTNLVLITLVALGGILALVQFRPGRWLEPAKKTPLPLNRVEDRILHQLQSAIQSDPSFLSEVSTISSLAERLETREHTLRRAINSGMGYKNFNDFLNDWRIRAACRELSQAGKARTSVVTIAMKVGFGSVGTFNRAFKDRTGMTPTDFRRRYVNAP